MQKLRVMALYLIILSTITSAQIIPTKIYVQEDPQPNMIEKYIPLKLVKTLGPEITKDVFIYKPTSLTVDREGNLYVFDRAQHKIFKFDRKQNFITAFGRVGQGPGEFSGSRGGMILINIGLDNKLYVNDMMAQKVIAFDTNGNYINDYRYTQIQWRKPTVDKKGNIFFFSGNDQGIKAKNQNGELVVNIPIDGPKVYSFLYEKQFLFQNKLTCYFMNAFLQPDHLLLYFEISSTMLYVADNKIVKSFQILPKDLLDHYKNSVQELVKKKDRGRDPLFSALIVEPGQKDFFYLPVIIDKTSNRSLVYKINSHGKLDKTFYMDLKKIAPNIWMEAIHDGIFYARLTNEQIIGIFKEDSK